MQLNAKLLIILAAMSSNLSISNLCLLINQTVDQYIVNSMVLRKDDQSELLVELSQALRQIHLWTHELRRDFNLKAKEQHEDCNCLMKLLSILMVLVGVESPFLRHLAGNVLEAVSEFIAVCVSSLGCLLRISARWVDLNLFVVRCFCWVLRGIFFLGFLCNCLRFAIENMLPYDEMPSVDGSVYWNLDLPSFCELEPALKNANWYTAGGVVGVLRNILKYLEHEDADQLLEVYLNSVGSMLIDLPWEQVAKVFLLQSIGICEIDAHNDHVTDVILGNAGENEPKVLFLGNFLQLLCSFVERAPMAEAEVGLEDKYPVLSIIINSLPKIFFFCLGEPGSAELSFKQYFGHKLLVLMLRLTYQVHHGNSQDDCLEGSPFSLAFYGRDGHGTHSRHLQRKTVFLFLKCCFNLISFTGETYCSCGFETRNCLTIDPDSCRKKGYSELYKWLRGHIPTEELMDYETYSEKYMGFVLSFLKLYMHEDDLLFKVLLQLLSVPSYSEKRLQGEKCSFGNVKDNILVHVLNLFNPVCLFHLFLAELHYDHQVLLDYLISKDTGISCAEYLLRSLRTVCNSRRLFKNFSLDRRVATDSSSKRKFQLDDCQTRPSSLPSSVQEKHKRDNEPEFSHSNLMDFSSRKPKIVYFL